MTKKQKTTLAIVAGILAALVLFIKYPGKLKALWVDWNNNRALIRSPFGLNWVSIDKIQMIRGNGRFNLFVQSVVEAEGRPSSVFIHLQDSQTNTTSEIVLRRNGTNTQDSFPTNISVTVPISQ